MTLKLQPTELATPVARALGKSTVNILEWHSTPLTGGGSTYAGGTGIYRVAGTAQAGDGIHHWSMILKMASGASPSAGHEPGARNYWRREAVAYQSGLLGALPGEAKLRDVVTQGGFRHFCRATETPFNLILEARP